MLVGGVMFFPGANYLLGNLDVVLRLCAELGNRMNFKITSLITVMVYYLINCQNCIRIEIETISYQALVKLTPLNSIQPKTTAYNPPDGIKPT